MAEISDANWKGESGDCNGGLLSGIGNGATVASSPVDYDYRDGDDISGDDMEYSDTVCNITSTGPHPSFTITVTPTASASLSPGWVPPNDDPDPTTAEANVNYSVDVTSIAITFDAPVITSGGESRCLVGQQVTAHLSITPDTPPIGSTANQYNWTETGGEPFSAYTTSTASGTVTLMTGTDTDAAPVYHFRKNQDAVLTCSGTINGQSF